ncbi:granulocyte-macrophage colony-stimulating factor receptor subunit alpha-like isoform 5-T8 [Sarcophilus harrisii]
MDYIKKVCCHFSNCNLNHGGEDTAAKNFSCIVYNIYFMNCTWTVGKAAPNHVQYYLYSQNAKKKQESECTNYIKDSQKRHVGCHFDELDRFGGKAYFLVTGSSKRIKIKNFCSEKISLFSIEKYNAPSNITVNCSKSNCLIQWQKPKTRIEIGDTEFRYMLCIQKLGSQYTNDTEIELPGSTKNEYVFTNFDMEKNYILKIRARHRRASWGYWSKPIEFGWTKYISVATGNMVEPRVQQEDSKRVCLKLYMRTKREPRPRESSLILCKKQEKVLTECFVPYNSLLGHRFREGLSRGPIFNDDPGQGVV